MSRTDISALTRYFEPRHHSRHRAQLLPMAGFVEDLTEHLPVANDKLSPQFEQH